MKQLKLILFAVFLCICFFENLHGCIELNNCKPSSSTEQFIIQSVAMDGLCGVIPVGTGVGIYEATAWSVSSSSSSVCVGFFGLMGLVPCIGVTGATCLIGWSLLKADILEERLVDPKTTRPQNSPTPHQLIRMEM